MLDSDGPQLDWQEAWDARKAELEGLLGPADDEVFPSSLPIRFGGMADVMLFRQFVDGCTYVTAGLTGTSKQPASELGQYELMMCRREPSEGAPSMLAMLSQMTLDEVVGPGEIIAMGEADDPAVTLAALITLEPDLGDGVENAFQIGEQACGLLLLVGVTAEEAEALQGDDSERVMALLREQVLPYTEPHRKSVV